MASLRLPARWLALALLIALLAIPLAGLGVALSGLWRADDEAAALADTASRFEAVAATRPDLVARRDALRAGLGRGEHFLGGTSAAISGAELQRLVGEVAAGSEAQIDNMLVLPARPEGAYQRIGLRVSLSTRIGPLQRILYSLEAGQPSLFVDALQVRAEDREAADTVLSVTLDIYGYRPGAEGRVEVLEPPDLGCPGCRRGRGARRPVAARPVGSAGRRRRSGRRARVDRTGSCGAVAGRRGRAGATGPAGRPDRDHDPAALRQDPAPAAA